MVKIMVFGTYDVLHKGHEFFLKKAKKHGDYLIVVVARDKTVNKHKKIITSDSEEKRIRKVSKLSYVDKAVLGSLTNKYAVIKKYEPGIIVLGHDQNMFTDGLKEKIKEFGLKTKIIRIKEAFNREKYNSTIIRYKENIKKIDQYR